MAALSYTPANEYVVLSGDHEQLQRPKASQAINGAALFFSLILKLEIPLLGRSYNPWVQDEALPAGFGTSFSVSRLKSPFDVLTSRIALLGQQTDQDVAFGVGPPRDRNDLIGKNGWYASKRIKGIAACEVPDRASDARALSPLVNELRILAQKSIKECDAIIDLYYVAWDELPGPDGRFWPRLIVENAQWGTLSDMLKEEKLGRDYDILANWATIIMEGIAALHAIGVAHCDLKPDNILIITETDQDDEGRGTYMILPKISDFGFSIIIDDYYEDDVSSRLMGTNNWNAPELALPTEVPVKALPKADIYSFGLLFAQLFLGTEPLFGQMTDDEVLNAKAAPGNLVEEIVRTSLSKSSMLPAEAQNVYDILSMCLSNSPGERCAARDILPKLAALTDVGIRRSRPRNTSSTPIGGTTNLVQATIGSNAGIPGMRNRHDIPQIRISGEESNSATFADYVAESHLAVPEFEYSFDNFDPFNIPDGALKAIVENLADIAADGGPTLQTSRAEASYELGILHCRGVGADKDIDTGLEWISRAITLGSNVAQRGGHNIFASYGRTMATEPQALVRTVLPNLARDELAWEVELVNSTYQTEYPFPATSFLRRERPEDYKVLLQDIAVHRASCFMFLLNSTYSDHSRSMIPLENIATFPSAITLATSWLEDPLVLAFLYDERAMFPDSTFVGPFTALQFVILLGEGEHVRRMMDNFQVDSREEGPTKLPPLWLACAMGYFDIAQVLLEHGADICCRDGEGGKSILHLLSQFKSAHHVRQLLEQGLEAGLDINNLDKLGRTPLHASNIGWDYSDGATAELLTERGARLAIVENGFTSIFLRSARDLNLPLMQSAVECLKSFPPSGSSSTRLSTKVRAAAFRRLLSFSELYRRRLLGGGYQERMEQIIHLLIDEKVSLELAVDPRYPTRTSTVLTACAVAGCNDFMEILLSGSLVSIDGTDSEKRNALMLCIERRNLVGAKILLQRGSNPHICNMYGNNCLQMAAENAPGMLMDVAAAALSHPARDHTKSDEEILHTSEVLTNTSAPPYVTALLHGNWEEAEHYRQMYNLRCERITVIMQSTQKRRDFSMLGFLIHLSLGHATASGLKAIKELLARCDHTGFTAESISQISILHWVTMRSETDTHLNWYNRHEIMKQILRRFPEEEYVHRKRIGDGKTALHLLVDANDWVGFRILQAHVNAHGFPLDVNAANHEKATPLNGIGKLRKALEDSGALSSTYDRRVWQSMVDDGHRLYRQLRALGGAFSDELWGICIRFVHESGDWLPRERLISFGTALAKDFKCAFEWIESDDDLKPLSQPEITRVLELRWAYNQFIIRGLEFKESSLLGYRENYVALAAANVEVYCGTPTPWTTKKYTKMERKQLSWQRKGQVWKTKAVQDLAIRFEAECTRGILASRLLAEAAFRADRAHA